jgi:hypothetical protein
MDPENISLADCLFCVRSVDVTACLLYNVAEPVAFGAVMGHVSQGLDVRILLARLAMYV